MKRREIVVEQAEPWGPIVARATTAEERAAAGARCAEGRRAARRDPGVVRVIEQPEHAEATDAADDGVRRTRRDDRDGARRRCPGADRADRGRPRGASVRRRAAAVPPRDREPRRHGSGDRRRPPRRPRGLAPGARHPPAHRWRPGRARDRARGRRARRALRRRRRRPAVAASLETLAIVAYRQPVTKAAVERIRGVDSDYTIRSLLHRRLDRRAGPVRGARPAVPVRDRLRLPRALRADEPRRAAAARRRRRGAAGRGGRRGRSPSRCSTRPTTIAGDADRRADDGARLMPTERLQKVLAAAGRRLAPRARGADRGRPRHGRRQGRDAWAPRSTRAGDHRGRRTGHRRAVGGRPTSLLHKPAGVTSTIRDRHAATTVLELLPTALVPDGARLYPVGRLDQDSEGLLLLTNDGGWADRVLHPRHGVEREYAIGLARAADRRAGRSRCARASSSTRAMADV